MTSDQNEIAEHFNEYFINLGPNLAVKIPTSLRNFDSYLGESYLNSVFLKAITINEEAREIDNPDADKSPGLTGYLQKLHSRTFNTYIITFNTYIILKWKLLLTPIFKSNDKESYSNYRSISVVPCFSKILEKLMYKRVIKFLDKHNILVPQT